MRKVAKFGGSSLASADQFKKVGERLFISISSNIVELLKEVNNKSSEALIKIFLNPFLYNLIFLSLLNS